MILVFLFSSSRYFKFKIKERKKRILALIFDLFDVFDEIQGIRRDKIVFGVDLQLLMQQQYLLHPELDVPEFLFHAFNSIIATHCIIFSLLFVYYCLFLISYNNFLSLIHTRAFISLCTHTHTHTH